MINELRWLESAFGEPMYRRRCMNYLRHTGSIPAAQALARTENFPANTSAWITTLGKMLKGMKP